MTSSQLMEKKRKLDDRLSKEEQRKFFMTFCERTCIDLIPTGLTARIRQKIAESGIMANKSPSEIDWTIIPENPDTPILDEDMMNIDSQLDEWENVVEDDVVDNTAAHASMQTTILCVILIFLHFFSSSQL